MKKVIIFLIIFMSGSLHSFLWGQNQQSGPADQQEYITEVNNKLNINMEDVDLKEFVRSMSAILKTNFVITSKLKGEVTIISPRPVSKELAFSILESVLDVHGYSIVKVGPVMKIIESAGTKTEGLDTRVGLEVEDLPGDKKITQIIPLNYIDARDVQTMFQPLVSKRGYLVAHEISNTIILTDRVSNVNRLKKILMNIDVEGSRSQIYHFRLKNADVEELVRELTPLFRTSRGPSIPTSSTSSRKSVPFIPSTGDSENMLVADVRTNTLLALCTPEIYIQISNLINLLDVPTPRVRDRIHVVYLNNAKAEELAEVLVKQVTTTSSRTRRTEKHEEPLLEDVQINADKATNSLIITAPPEDFLTLSEVISKLDVRRSQVLVEALILELSLDKTKEFGVEWQALDPESDYYKAFGGTNLPTGTDSTGALNQLGSDSNPYSGANPAGLMVGAIKGPVYWGKNLYYSIAGLARALQADTDVNILLTPHIVTYDNEESEIIVGEERPFLKSSQTSTEGSVIRTFEFKDVGTTLRLTPHISQGDAIRLEIFTEIKNFVEQVDVGAITTTKRHVKTSVQVEDGQTIVLGGLIKEDRRISRSMVPCLGNIWGLGWLFKSQKGQSVKTNLLIFIKPSILKSGEDIERVTLDKQKQHENTQMGKSQNKNFPLEKWSDGESTKDHTQHQKDVMHDFTDRNDDQDVSGEDDTSDPVEE